MDQTQDPQGDDVIILRAARHEQAKRDREGESDGEPLLRRAAPRRRARSETIPRPLNMAVHWTRFAASPHRAEPGVEDRQFRQQSLLI
jgi:hypothetical protein